VLLSDMTASWGYIGYFPTRPDGLVFLKAVQVLECARSPKLIWDE
jgi:hypothetical protein